MPDLARQLEAIKGRYAPDSRSHGVLYTDRTGGVRLFAYPLRNGYPIYRALGAEQRQPVVKKQASETARR
jgi:hypothetical protein